MYEATERLYLTADGLVCREGDPEAASLLIAPGQTMSDEEAKQYGLTVSAEEVNAEEDAEVEPKKKVKPKKKAVKPAEDKAVKPAENKIFPSSK